MTLLVGAVFPWPELANRLSAFQVARQLGLLGSGVFIAADSRWTFPDGHCENGAVKVFGLRANGIMGYSGPAGAGENALVGLELGFTRPSESLREFIDVASSSISAATRGDITAGLEVLVGWSTRSSDAYLVRFSFADGFAGELCDSLVAVGADVAITYFKQAMTAHIVETSNQMSLGHRSVSMDLTPWATVAMGIIHEIGEIRADPKVGGAVMCATSIKGKSSGLGATRLSPGGSLGVNATEIGLAPETGMTVRRAWQYGP